MHEVLRAVMQEVLEAEMEEALGAQKEMQKVPPREIEHQPPAWHVHLRQPEPQSQPLVWEEECLPEAQLSEAIRPSGRPA
ncbi:hypothetical protein X767_30865 [Mesorhizobium sp. LSJC264A00]|nr:hypothetical protein X767_30865 [Mesorhizobium sp. LSJC264A00]